MIGSLMTWGRMVKFSHSIFALPSSRDRPLIHVLFQPRATRHGLVHKGAVGIGYLTIPHVFQ